MAVLDANGAVDVRDVGESRGASERRSGFGFLRRSLLVPAGAEARLRPEIQGLRALAVALVVVYHLMPARLPGGYIGVDVFFVISGYLITSHLVGEVDRNGRVRLLDFWARRARRLLPASVLVLIVSFALVMTVVPASVRLANLREIGASVLYAQNWLLAGNSIDYLAASNSPSLVQHFWSLSTEEQFYLVWPLLIAASLLVARKRSSIAAALVVVLVLSFVASVHLVATSPGQAYFVTYSRAWEFAAGGLLAFAPHLRGTRARAVLGWVGVGAIGGAASVFTATTPFPGVAALLPVLGTAAVIVSGAPDRSWAPSTIARLSAVQYLGGISYSVYLWHFPIIRSYVLVRGHEPEGAALVAVLALTLCLAALTKRYVEDRFRRAPVVGPGRRRTYLAVAAAMVAVVLATTGASTYVEAQNERQAALALERVQHGDPCYSIAATVPSHRCEHPFSLPAGLDTSVVAADSTHQWCLEPYAGTALKTCDFGDTDAPVRRVALLGDSHANVLVDGLAVAAQARHWEISTFVKEGCPAVPTGPLAGHLTRQDALDCSTWSAAAVRRILADREIDTVLFTNASNARSYYAGIPASAYRDMLERMVRAGKRVVVMYDVPKPAMAGAACIESWRATGRECTLSRAAATAGGASLREAARSVKGVRVLDPTAFFCDEDCHVVVGGVGAYFDIDHITTTISVSLAPQLASALSGGDGSTSAASAG